MKLRTYLIGCIAALVVAGMPVEADASTTPPVTITVTAQPAAPKAHQQATTAATLPSWTVCNTGWTHGAWDSGREYHYFAGAWCIINAGREFILQQDGHMVVYSNNTISHTALWAAGGPYYANSYLDFQRGDGNVCTRDRGDNHALWCAGAWQTQFAASWTLDLFSHNWSETQLVGSSFWTGPNPWTINKANF